MRDLGAMGESTFCLWCAESGLIQNGSRIDRTGWDFLVEFPFQHAMDADKLHRSAIECKVQVKATDKNDRKLQITLSNLRRLITAQMPTFFLFIEFDGCNRAQRAFMVHVDANLVSKVLKRIHELEQCNGKSDLNKRTLTIHYGNEHEMESLSGACLKSKIEKNVGDDMAKYVSQKKDHLESTGFESGSAKITITTQGRENLIDLVDVSIGAKKSVEISGFKGFLTRFGIQSKTPMLEADSGTLEMPDLLPTTKGIVRFREDKLAPSLAFECELYISPLAAVLPNELRYMRVVGDFFELKLNPYTTAAEYTFPPGVSRLTINKLRDAVRLYYLLTASSKHISAELSFDGLPIMNLTISGQTQPFELSEELEALEAASKIIARFETSEPIEVTLLEIHRNTKEIRQLASMLSSDETIFKIIFSVKSAGFDASQNVACIFLVQARIGSYVLGVIAVVTGPVIQDGEDQFCLLATSAKIERKIVSGANGEINGKDLVQVIEAVEHKYGEEFAVVTMFDKDGEPPATTLEVKETVAD